MNESEIWFSHLLPLSKKDSLWWVEYKLLRYRSAYSRLYNRQDIIINPSTIDIDVLFSYAAPNVFFTRPTGISAEGQANKTKFSWAVRVGCFPRLEFTWVGVAHDELIGDKSKGIGGKKWSEISEWKTNVARLQEVVMPESAWAKRKERLREMGDGKE